MLSIIICSRNSSDFEKVKANIAQTIGCPHEVICMDNSANHYSISRAYNEGARRSQYPFLCFVHEDVAFLTPDWGLALLAFLEQETIGLVGVAGGILKTKATGPTWWSPLAKSARLHLVQHNANGEKRKIYENPLNEPYSQVATLDGVFMACRKEVWAENRFDEKAIKGFHFYDLDFSLAIGQHYKVIVAYSILLEHFSEGRNDKVWAEQADKVTAKWKSKLPVCTQPIEKATLEEIEKQTQDFYLSLLIELKCRKSLLWKYILVRCLAYPSDAVNVYYLKMAIKELWS